MCIASSVPSLGSPPEGMGRAKFRTLKDLYQSTNHQASWPFKSEMEEKSRSCNPCDTWSSSSMHFERVAASVGVGTDRFTNKTYGEKRSRCSSGDGFLFSPSLSASCDCRQRTSSETSNVCSVSSSHDSIFENTESQATFRVSYSCKAAESLINVRKAQSCGRSGDTPKGFTNFDHLRFSNLLEKHELEISGDNVSCISRSERASLAIGYQNSGHDRKSASCRSASDDSVPEPDKVVNSHFVESNCNHRDAQFFSEEPRLAWVVFPNRSDFLLKDYYNSAISVKGEPSQGSIEQRESSLARAAQSRFDCQTYCEKRLPKSIAVIENTGMEKSWQIHQANPIAVSHLMDYEVTVCDICGDAGQKHLLAICNKCSDGAEHTYCMRVMLHELPGSCWMCEECRSECQKSGSPVNLESWSSTGLRSRSSHARKIQTKGTSSASHTPIKRPGVPSEAQSAENDRDIKMNAEPPRSSKPCDNALLDWDLSHKSVKNGKAKATKGVTSEILISSHPQDKAKAPSAYGNKRDASTLEVEFNKKRKALVETRATLSATSKPTADNSLQSGEHPLKKLRKPKLEAGGTMCLVKQSSCGSQGKLKLPSPFGDESLNLGLETEIVRDKCSQLKSGSSKNADLKYKGQLAKVGDLQKRKVDRYPAFHAFRSGKNSGLVSKSVSFNRVTSSSELNATCSEVILALPAVLKNSGSVKEAKIAKCEKRSELHNSATCLPSKSRVAEEKGENRTISRNKTFFSGSDCVRSCGEMEGTFNRVTSSAELNATCSEVILALPAVLKNSGSVKEAKTAKMKKASELHNSATCLPSKSRVAEEKSENRTISRNKTFFSGSDCVQSCGEMEGTFNRVTSSAELNATCSEVILALPAVLKNSGSVKEAKTAKMKKASELHNSATCLPSKSREAVEKSENRTISRNKTFFSGSDYVQSCGELEGKLQPNNHKAPRDLDWLNKRKKNERWQTEQPTEAASAIKSHELCTDIVCGERSQFDMAVLSKEFVFPMPDCIWLGEFKIRSSKGVAITLAGLQAQLSSRASKKVLEVADELPGVIVVEELPRLRMWPSQFMERPATEDNIALYFFAKDRISYDTHHRRLVNYMTENDLALKGNLNGFELLIFSSGVLPEKSQRWNKLLFLWGVFRGRKINNSAKTPVSNSQKQDIGEIVRRSRAFDLNVCPEDEEDIHEIAEFNSIGASSSGVKDVKGKTILEEKNDADNVEPSEDELDALKAAVALCSLQLVQEKK